MLLFTLMRNVISSFLKYLMQFVGNFSETLYSSENRVISLKHTHSRNCETLVFDIFWRVFFAISVVLLILFYQRATFCQLWFRFFKSFLAFYSYFLNYLLIFFYRYHKRILFELNARYINTWRLFRHEFTSWSLNKSMLHLPPYLIRSAIQCLRKKKKEYFVSTINFEVLSSNRRIPNYYPWWKLWS